MRIVFIGAVEFSRRALERLFELRANVVGVCTLASSGVNADHCDLRSTCSAHGVDWLHAPNINSDECLQWIAARRPDVIFCFGWSRLLRRPLLQLAPLGVVGFHPAELPANRGRHPLIWALVLGLPHTAATFFFMDEGADSGDILSQRRFAIEPADDAGTLYEKMTQCALEQMSEFVPQLAAGRFSRMPQDASGANSWRKRGRADGQVDWRMSSRSIHNLVRALAKPYVGAHFLHKGNEVKLWKTELVMDTPVNAEPGKVLAVTSRGPVLACGERGLLLLRTEPECVLAAGEYL
ncbi:MAG: formyl transferase [Proteobacteria bacterium]|nr:formyl transferase [Pseudomonadota bacterium]